ncbi:LysR family transcriptional regulator [Pseudonocardia eucalypti]|uniref:LysR family transcriptional regulator n=1 Tax=Pseudonocardia eucalypti TaxID=648755 RepID=A0ABP9R1S1_9PSEU|nr:DNA-binding transcriptional LysR family regulator [Pseudonocardia eucalypti]
MQLPDLNLLPALDALLRTESVSEAAEAMHVSPSAMSRTLRRLRRVMGDPLLVPSGRGLALTPRALSLRASVEAATAGALAALQPPQPTDIASISRRFVIRANDAMAVVLGGALTARAATQAPGIRLRIVPEGEELPTELRDRVDLDVGVQPELPHDVRSQPLSEHRYAAVARADAPFAGEPLTVERFAALPHLTVSRRGRERSVVDELLAELGHRRTVLATVPTASAACFLAGELDALALVPEPFARRAARSMPLAVLEIPLDLPPNRIEMAWHLRSDTDPAHRWLRATLLELARAPTPQT